jgi:hypothetical protein
MLRHLPLVAVGKLEQDKHLSLDGQELVDQNLPPVEKFYSREKAKAPCGALCVFNSMSHPSLLLEQNNLLCFGKFFPARTQGQQSPEAMLMSCSFLGERIPDDGKRVERVWVVLIERF